MTLRHARAESGRTGDEDRRQRAGTGGDAGDDHFKDLKWVSSVIAAITAAAAVLTWWYGYIITGWRFQPQMLWGIALWCAGGGVGFLFAIPRVLQGPKPAASAASTQVSGPVPNAPANGLADAKPQSSTPLVYEQRVNNNLEEISDWLTKIIVGVTLVQLNNVPDLLWRLAAVVVSDLPHEPGATTSDLGYGTALIVTFLILGFMFGYLVTRLYLQGAIDRAERRLGAEERVRDAERRAETEELAARVLGGVAEPAAQLEAVAAQAPPPPSEETQRILRGLADEYRAINIANWAQRTEAKNRIAAKLSQTVLKDGVSRDWLAEQDDEGLLLALATTVVALPEPGDAARLLKAAPRAKRMHVQYRMATAFGRLLDRRLLPTTDWPALRKVLVTYLENADQPLSDVVRAVLKQIA